MGGIGLRSGEEKDEICGFELATATKTVGPSACARTLEELVIPAVDSKPEVQLVHLKPETLSSAALKKNAGLGTLLAASGIGGLAMLFLAVRQLRSGQSVREVDPKNPT